MPAPYTDQQRTEAVACYLQHGLAEAHRRTGIPKPTLSGWLTPEQKQANAERSEAKTEATKAATTEHVRLMAEQRIEAQREFMASAVVCARKTRTANDGTDAFGWARAGGTALDKVRLELGEATDRTEHVSPERTAEQERELDRTLRLVQDRAA